MTDAILTADPTYIDLAWRELQRTTTATRKRATLADGILLVSFNERFSVLGETWRQAPPTFVRHLAPAEIAVDCDGTAEDGATIKREVRKTLLDAVPTGARFSVQTRLLAPDLPYKPFDINSALADAIADGTGARLDVRRPEYVISVAVALLSEHLVALVGVSPVVHNLSDWAGGERRFKREPDQISRAEFKLLEALEQFRITLPKRAVALDLGAAPGGWTRVLRRAEPELIVMAVDPGELDPQLRGEWGVHHARLTAETYFASLTDQTFDIVLNDMRLDARLSADLLTRVAGRINPGGFAIMTAKLPQYDAEQRLNDTRRILERVYTIRGARQLFHNRNEVTLYLQPKTEQATG